MPEIPSRKLESEMNVASEMKRSMMVLAGPRLPSDTRESMLARAARRAGISFRQAKTFFYGESTDPRASVVERVRAAIDKANAGQEAKARAEFEHVRDQIALLEQRLAALAADMDREDAAVGLARFVADGPLDRTVGEARRSGQVPQLPRSGA